MLENVKKYWPILAIAMVAGAFFAGRWSKKPDIQYKEKIVVQSDTKTEATTKTEVATKTDTHKNKDLHIKKVVVKNKDGSSTATTIIDSTSQEDKTKDTVKYVDRIVYQDKIVVKEVEKTKTVTYPQPEWQLGLKLGVDVSHFGPDSQFPYVQPFLIGLEGDKRLAGPVWIGVWGMTDTRFNNITAGLSVMAQF